MKPDNQNRNRYHTAVLVGNTQSNRSQPNAEQITKSIAKLKNNCVKLIFNLSSLNKNYLPDSH